jgi:hypothetical protein
MKKMNFICFFVCLLLMVSCKKVRDHLPPGVPPKGGIDEKKYTLKKMTHGTREYLFYFNKKRLVDSIRVNDIFRSGVYRVIRRNDRIDSVRFVSVRSVPDFINYGYEFDKAGNITRFNQFHPPLGPPEPIDITYLQGDVHTITSTQVVFPDLTTHDTLDYVNKNLARWATNTRLPVVGDVLDRRFYTYDREHFNPLYFIDDLMAILSFADVVFFEPGVPVLLPVERYLWEYILSPNVSLTKFYDLYQEVITYENFYDSNGRLIKKKFTEHGQTQADSLTFEYLK